MRVSDNVKEVLGCSRVEGQQLFLPEGQLDRGLYMAVNKVLESLGGKWNRKVKAHVFDKDVEDMLEQVLSTGEYVDAKKEYQFFETPPELAEYLVNLARIVALDTVLEPSAGRGSIASLIKRCDCVELMPQNRQYLIEQGFNVVGEDFMTFDKQYDVIVANPPFSKRRDIDHILHMIDLARKRVVSVASASLLFRQDRKTKEFIEKVKREGGTITSLPEGTFKSSGTMVNTCVVFVDKTEKESDHENKL